MDLVDVPTNSWRKHTLQQHMELALEVTSLNNFKKLKYPIPFLIIMA
jgi:hypothetical protein